MDFIKITAQQCSNNGDVKVDDKRVEIEINKDLIAGRVGDQVYMKTSGNFKLGDRFYKDFRRIGSSDYFA